MEIGDMIDELAELRTLVSSPGWKRVVEYLKENIHDRDQRVLRNPCKSIDETLAQEFMKGEATGIESMFVLVDTKITELDAFIEAAKKERSNGEAKEEGDDFYTDEADRAGVP